MIHMAPCTHERLLRRPKDQDPQSATITGHNQERGRPRLRREPLLAHALHEESRPRRIPSPEEEPRICSAPGPESYEALGGGSESRGLSPPFKKSAVTTYVPSRGSR